MVAIAESLFENTLPFPLAASAHSRSLPVGQSDPPKPAFELNVYAGAPEGVQQIDTNG